MPNPTHGKGKGVARGPYATKNGRKPCRGPLHKLADGSGTLLPIKAFYKRKRHRARGRYLYYSSWCRACTKHARQSSGIISTSTIRPATRRILEAHDGMRQETADYIGIHLHSLRAILGDGKNAQRTVHGRTAQKVMDAIARLRMEHWPKTAPPIDHLHLSEDDANVRTRR